MFALQTPFWFILLSPFIYLIGELCLWAHRHQLNLPISIGINLLITMLVAIIFVPVSGFWLGLLPSILMLTSSKSSVENARRASKE